MPEGDEGILDPSFLPLVRGGDSSIRPGRERYFGSVVLPGLYRGRCDRSGSRRLRKGLGLLVVSFVVYLGILVKWGCLSEVH